MRLFLSLCTLATLAYAKPQQGYNYGTGISGNIGSGSSTHFSSLGGSGGGGYQSGGFTSGLSAPSAGFGFQSSSGGFRGGSSGGSSFNQQYQSGGFEAPFVHKQFISISAPEDHESLEQSKHFVIGRPQKNYRVVFIKAPSSSSANVKLSAEYAPQEEKTVIYVLSKKDSSLEVNDIATPAPTVPTKPEVFFIKYKTEEEAQHAQRQIQSEYDKIEGTSEHTDGGVAPQQSVVGILDGGAGGSIGGGSIGGGSIGGGNIGGGSIGGGSIGGGSIGGGIGIGSGIGGGSGFLGSSSGTFGVSHSGSSGTKGSTYLPPTKVL